MTTPVPRPVVAANPPPPLRALLDAWRVAPVRVRRMFLTLIGVEPAPDADCRVPHGLHGLLGPASIECQHVPASSPDLYAVAPCEQCNLHRIVGRLVPQPAALHSAPAPLPAPPLGDGSDPLRAD